MIKLTVLQLLNAIEPLQELVKQPLRGIVAFKIRRLINAVRPEVAAASPAKDALFTDDNSTLCGNGRALKPECIQAFFNDPLFAAVVDLVVVPLTGEDLADARISVAQLELLGPLFCDEGV